MLRGDMSGGRVGVIVVGSAAIVCRANVVIWFFGCGCENAQSRRRCIGSRHLRE